VCLGQDCLKLPLQHFTLPGWLTPPETTCSTIMHLLPNLHCSTSLEDHRYVAAAHLDGGCKPTATVLSMPAANKHACMDTKQALCMHCIVMSRRHFANIWRPSGSSERDVMTLLPAGLTEIELRCCGLLNKTTTKHGGLTGYAACLHACSCCATYI
jgi:hypothetical protein